MPSCPDCYPDLSLASFGKGDGRCKHCNGTGEWDESGGGALTEFFSLNTVHPDITCRICSGTGQCQTCGGTGRVSGYSEDEPEEDDYSENENYSNSYEPYSYDSKDYSKDQNHNPITKSSIIDKIVSQGFTGALVGSVVLGIGGCYSCIWDEMNSGGIWHTDFQLFGGLLYGFIIGGCIGALTGFVSGSYNSKNESSMVANGILGSIKGIIYTLIPAFIITGILALVLNWITGYEGMGTLIIFFGILSFGAYGGFQNRYKNID